MSEAAVPNIETPAASPNHEPTPSAPTSPAARKAMFIVFLVVFIDLLGFGIVLPLLPIYGDRYVAQLIPGGKEAPAGGAIVGLLMASFSAMQFLFAPLWGRVSDRIGRRPILLLGLGGSVVCYSVFGYASDLDPTELALLALILLFVARMGAGIAGATISTAQAVIADCTTPEKRKHGMALIGAAFGIGFTFGPLLGAGSLWLLPNHHGAIGYAAAGLSLLALVLGLVLLPETRRFDTAPPLRRKWFDTQAIRFALGNPALAPVVWCFFLATLGFGGLEVTLSLLNRDALHLEESQNFLPFAYVGFVLMLTQGFLYRRLASRVSEATFMAVGIACLGLVTWLDFIKWETPALLWSIVGVGLTAAVVGFAFLTPSAQALVSRRSDPARQGEILGVNQSASAMARILGPILFLTLYKLHPSHLLPYALGAGLLLAMLPLMPRIRRGG